MLRGEQQIPSQQDTGQALIATLARQRLQAFTRLWDNLQTLLDQADFESSAELAGLLGPEPGVRL